MLVTAAGKMAQSLYRSAKTINLLDKVKATLGKTKVFDEAVSDSKKLKDLLIDRSNFSVFNNYELKIISETEDILKSSEMQKIIQAYKDGTPITVNINGRIVQYEPNLKASGLSMFGENGFLIGIDAFASEAELQKTILHELHRLYTSNVAGGVSQALVTTETIAAKNFSDRAHEFLSKMKGNK